MKTVKLIFMMLVFCLLSSMYTNLHAQDPVKVAPNIYKKILLDNDKVRVIDAEIAPGDVVPWHSHPDHIAYALTDGKIEITDKGKAGVIVDIKAGEALYLTAVTHMAKNIGTSTIKLVITEIKSKGGKKPMMTKEAK
ncbi:cupin domain-containing protein [Flavobacterium pedocola]